MNTAMFNVMFGRALHARSCACNGNADVGKPATAQGSCGYGLMDKSKYPYWSVGALSTSNMYYSEGPVQGCGCASFPAAGPPLHPCMLFFISRPCSALACLGKLHDERPFGQAAALLQSGFICISGTWK